MQAYNNIILPVSIFILVVLIIFIIWRELRSSSKFKQLIAQIDAANLVSEEYLQQTAILEQRLAKADEGYDKWRREQEQVTEQLIHRTKQMQLQIKELTESIDKLANMQPEDKLYSRAQKMVQLGADKEEILRECQLPLAEVEILLSMHTKKSS